MTKKSGKRPQKRMAPRPKQRPSKTGSLGNALLKWQSLLRDPCAGGLTHPIYSGMDAGYLVRTVDTYVPKITNASTGPTTMDWIGTLTPWNYSNQPSGHIFAGGVSGANLTTSTGGFTGNWINNILVRSFRPVAACAKWIPSGPINTRQGIVGMAYTPSQMLTTGVTYQAEAVRGGMQKIASNGSCMHEVKWLPTTFDEVFGNNFVVGANQTGCGSMTTVLSGIDATGNGTYVTANGAMEYTVVWEWCPSPFNGIVSDPVLPSPYTLNAALGTLGDIGTFLFGSAENARNAAYSGAGMLASAAFGQIRSPTLRPRSLRY